MGPDGMSMVNGTTGVHGEEYWTDGGNMSQVRPSSPQAQAQGQSQAQPQRQVSDVYSNTLPVRRPAPAKNKNPVGKSSEKCWNAMRDNHKYTFLIRAWDLVSVWCRIRELTSIVLKSIVYIPLCRR